MPITILILAPVIKYEPYYLEGYSTNFKIKLTRNNEIELESGHISNIFFALMAIISFNILNLMVYPLTIRK